MAKDIDKAFLEAAEIAKKLPENLQEVAFSRALDHLLGSERSTKISPAASRPTKKTPSGGRGKGDDSGWINTIDRTAYPDVGATERVADRALKVLLLAHQDYGVDGLTATEIATILNHKFRLPVKQNSVVKALDRETGNVDVRAGPGGSRVFHIMAPGEAYLHGLSSGNAATPNTRPLKSKSGRTSKSAPKKRLSTQREKISEKANAPAKKPGKGSRPGPKAAIQQLIQSGFFQTPRAISAIQQELQHRRGHGYSIQELAPALVRSIRDNSLQRERTEVGQYEYSAT